MLHPPPRFTTHRIARLVVDGWPLELRIVERDARFHLMTNGALDANQAHPSVDAATASASTSGPIDWRTSLAPLADERPCPICSAPVGASSRYPRAVCPACVLEGVDADGQELRFSNIDLSGGFAAQRADGTSPSHPHACLIRGLACHADEARFGGIVVELVARDT